MRMKFLKIPEKKSYILVIVFNIHCYPRRGTHKLLKTRGIKLLKTAKNIKFTDCFISSE